MKVITATSADTNYGVDELLLALNANERIHCARVSIQALVANTADILIGDDSLSATNYGMRLRPGDAWVLDSGSGANDVNLNDLYIRGEGAASQKVSVAQFIS